MIMSSPFLQNPHLEGEAFFWEGGPVGVLLSHGFTATSAEVRLLAQKLHEKGFTVAGPLLPGHGTRPEDLNRVHWQDWVQAGEETYRQLAAHCQNVFVGGESTGALVALSLASQHPQVAGLLLYAPAIKLNLSAWQILLLHLLAPFKAWVPKGSSDGNAYWQGYTVNPLKGTIQLLRFQTETKRLLPTIRRPVLVMQGRLDATVHSTVGEIILGNIHSAMKEQHWMGKSGHVIILEQELDQITEITLDFMEKALGHQ
jgi:carboxylesterase